MAGWHLDVFAIDEAFSFEKGFKLLDVEPSFVANVCLFLIGLMLGSVCFSEDFGTALFTGTVSFSTLNSEVNLAGSILNSASKKSLPLAS